MKRVVVGVENHFMFNEVVCSFCNTTHQPPVVQCTNCGKILPFYTLNPYALFQITPTLHVSSDVLDSAYYQFQRVLHPDKVRNASDQELQWADAHVSQINEAYKTLKTTLGCAKAAYLYTQNLSYPVSAFDPNWIPQPDINFLTLMMELNGNKGGAEVDQLYSQVEQELEQAIESLTESKILPAIAKFTYLARLTEV